MKSVVNWPIIQSDVRDYDFSDFASIDLLAGGPPCQPFSLGGKHRGNHDERNLFPHMIRAVREIKPKVVIIENVKGLLRSSFSKYFAYILLQLQYPEIVQKEQQAWEEHLSRLEKYHVRGMHDGLHYRVVFRLLNAADYGVPQRRERVFIVAFRNDLQKEWAFPTATHSQDALLYEKWVTGDYWELHEVSKKHRPDFPEKWRRKIALLQNQFMFQERWKTVRDATCNLPDPEFEVVPPEIANHSFYPGARVYPGHTGSPLDEPAKTLKAGDHGVPGGENMLVRLDGSVRYFSIRESARLQTFPDDYIFCGSWSENMRQLGNAVPVQLSHVIASSLRRYLEITNAQEGNLTCKKPPIIH